MSPPRRLWPRSMGTPMIRILSGIEVKPFQPLPREGGELRINAVQHTWEGDYFADVLGSANPRHGALQAHSKPRVGHAAVPAQVQIPLKQVRGEILRLQAVDQFLVVRQTLAAAND